jgi:hypothetical protein
MVGSALRMSSSSWLATVWASVRVAIGGVSTVRKTTRPSGVSSVRTCCGGTPVRFGERANAGGELLVDRCGRIDCDGALQRFQVRLHVEYPGVGADRRLDALGYLVGLGQRELGRKLQVQREKRAVGVIEDGDVVRFAYGSFHQGRGKDAIAQVTATLGLDVHDNIASR